MNKNKFKKRDIVIIVSPKVSLNNIEIINHSKHMNRVWWVDGYSNGQLGWQYSLTDLNNDNNSIAWVYEKQLMSLKEAIEKGFVKAKEKALS